MIKNILAVCCLLMLSTIAQTQDSDKSEIITAIENDFKNGNIYDAEIKALQAIHSGELISTDDLLEAHKYLAFCYVAYGESAKAKKEFLQVLSINSNFRLDQSIYSPKITDIFDEAVKEYTLLKSKSDEPGLRGKNSWVQLQAGKKSLIFPGLGQIEKKQTIKGYAFAGGETISIIVLIYSQWQFMESHDEYLNAVSPDDIEKKYDKYNMFYKIRNFSAAGAVLIYTAGFIDALYYPVNMENKAITVGLNPSGFRICVNL